MPVNLQQYRGAVGAFNSRFNHNNIHKSGFHRKPNALSLAGTYLAILIISSSFLSVIIGFCLIVLFRKNIKTVNLLVTKIRFIYMLSNYWFHIWLFLIRTKRSGDI